MKKYDNKTIEKLIFRYFNIRNFQIRNFNPHPTLTLPLHIYIYTFLNT